MPSSKNHVRFPHRVAIIQRLLPAYRVPFFEQLAGACASLKIFAGLPADWEGIRTTDHLQQAQLHSAKNWHIGQGKFYFCWQQGLRAWLKHHPPDLLVVEANARLLSNYYAVWRMKFQKRPVVGWSLGILDWQAPAGILLLRKWVLRLFYGQFDALITYSSKGARHFQDMGIAPEKIFIAHNAVAGTTTETALTKIQQHPEWLTQWKARWHLSENPIILFVGRLIPGKEVGNLIQACSALGEACEVVIVGDGPERENLEILANHSPTPIHFLGHQTGEPLSLCFATADLFVLPGLGGLAIQEAMGYGKPVIVALGDGTQADLVQEGKNGFLVPAGDVDSLSHAIQKCLQDREILRQMGHESLRIVREEFNLETMENAFLRALEYALASTS